MDRRLKISKSHRRAGVAVHEFGPKGGRFGDALGLDSPSGLHRAGLFFRQKKAISMDILCARLSLYGWKAYDSFVPSCCLPTFMPALIP